MENSTGKLAATVGILYVATALVAAGSTPVAAEGHRFLAAGKQKTTPTNREWLLKRKFLQRRLRRNDAELQRVIAQLDQIARKLSPAGMGLQQKAQLRARRNRVRVWSKSQSRLSAKLSLVYRAPGRLSRSDLNAAIREVERMRESVRNKRQMASTAFQNFDQKANQLYNLLSSVMKAMQEMRQAPVRNML